LFSKYKNSKTTFAGRRFDSKAEAGLFGHLKLLELAGEIKDIRCQESVYLTDARIQYIADFSCFHVESNQKQWVEFKGLETAVWRIKRRLWMHYGPGKLVVYKGSHKRIFIAEEIVPK